METWKIYPVDQMGMVEICRLIDGVVVDRWYLHTAEYVCDIRYEQAGNNGIYSRRVATGEIITTVDTDKIVLPAPELWNFSPHDLLHILNTAPYFSSFNGQDYTIKGYSSTRDAAGNVRTSGQGVTLFDNKFSFGIDDAFWDVLLENGATAVHEPLNSGIRLTVPAVAGARAVLQTKQNFIYQAGKSFLNKITGVLHSAIDAGLLVRWGYFNDANDISDPAKRPFGGNGLFIEYSQGNYYLVQRSSTSGTQVDTRIMQEDWNIDPINGTSAIDTVADFTKTQLIATDFLWQGVGDVRTGLYLNNILRYAHQFQNGNVIEVPYMSTANLPLRFEIANVLGNIEASSLVICQEIKSEAGYDPTGYTTPWDMVGTESVSNTEHHLVSFRYKDGRLQSLSKPVQFTNITSTGGNMVFRLYLNADLSTLSPAWTPLSDNSNLDFWQENIDLNADVGVSPVVANARLIDVFKHSQDLDSVVGQAVDERIKLGSAIDGTSDTLTLTASKIVGGGSEQVSPSIKFSEFV